MKIYYAEIRTLSEAEKQQMLLFLPKERVERILRMKSEKSQMQSITAGLLLEYALKERGLSGKELTFIKNMDGKPHIKELPEFSYNLTHCTKYAALAVDTHPIGIDIEGIHKDGRKLAERFFSEEEKKELSDNWSDEAFTKIWTRKESYLKAVGIGMRMPLDAFSVLEEKVQIKEHMPFGMVERGDSYYIKSVLLERSFMEHSFLGNSLFPQDIWLSVCRKNAKITDADMKLEKVRIESIE